MPAAIDHTGHRFDRLLAIKRVESKVKGIAYWECLCNCGNTHIARANDLRQGVTRSCGCLNKENSAKHIRQYNESLGIPPGAAAMNCVFLRYKNSAKIRDLKFELTKEEVKFLTLQNCHYCGQEPSNVYTQKDINGVYKYNGIDRVDPSKGYCLSNCRPCCALCNYMKLDSTEGEFYGHIRKIAKHKNLNIP